MGSLTVYGSKVSVSTRRVLLTLDEKGIEYDFVAVNMAKKEQKVPKHADNVYCMLTLDGIVL